MTRMTDVVLPPTFETTASFTPGKWEFREIYPHDDGLGYISADGHDIIHAGVGGLPAEENRANARLIAAAPELLAVATKLDEFWTAEFPGGPDGSAEVWGGIARLSDETLGIWRQARAAIAAAKAGA